jgi:hypothetical protein
MPEEEMVSTEVLQYMKYVSIWCCTEVSCCTNISGSYIYIYCHVFQWLRRRLGLLNRFIGFSLVVTTISSCTLEITVTIAHVTSHNKSSNSSSGHTAVPLELQNPSHFPFPYSFISFWHRPRTENTVLLLRSADHTEASHMITVSPVHWRADCCLATNCKHSSYCCVWVSRGVYRAVAWQCVDIYVTIYIYILWLVAR